MNGATPFPVHDPENGVHATVSQRCANQAQLADQIRHGWTETLERIVETGKQLIEGRFRRADYQRHALPFSYSWGKKLEKIARSPRILNPVNRPILPSKTDALHQIALLADRLFNLGVREGVINNQCLVIDIRQFRQSFMEPGQPIRRRITVVYECSPERFVNATDTLDSFVVAVQQLAETRFPTITARRPRRMKELVLG
jgi:hypothetical protein